MVRVHHLAGRPALLATAVCAFVLLTLVTPSVTGTPTLVGPRGSRDLPLASASPPLYPVNFTEGGLPAGLNWTVTLGSVSHSSAGPSLLFYEPNGTYSYSIGSVGGYVPTQAMGNLTVHGGNDTVVATLQVAGAKPWGGAADPLTGDVFMAYRQNGNLSILNGTTLTNQGSIPVGKNPGTPIYDAQDGELFVPDAASNNLTVVDPATHARVANVKLANLPATGAFDPANGLVYVADSGSNVVSVLNGTNFSVVATLRVGTAPNGVAYDPLDHDIYVANQGSDNVSVISGTPGTVVLSIPLTAHSGPFGVAFDAANGRLYVTQQGAAACPGGGSPCMGAVINASTNAYNGTFPEGPTATYPSFDVANGLLYVPNAVNPGTLTVLSASNPTPVGLVSVGSNPETAAVDPTNGLVYSANFAANTISVIDGTFYHESVEFVPRPPALYGVNFTESGLPTGTSWSVSVNGTLYGTIGSAVLLSETNGTYPFVVENVSGFHDAPASGTIAVHGADVSVSIVFTPIPPPTYPIAFVATGLPAGTNWSVTVGSAATGGNSSELVVNETDGIYTYTVPSVPGFDPTPATGVIDVLGTGQTVDIRFNATSTGGAGGGSAPGNGPLGSLARDPAGLIGVAVLVAAVIGLVAFVVARRRKESRSGSSIPSLAAAAGLPPPLGQAATPPPTPASPDPLPPPSLPRPPTTRPKAPPPRPDWSEE